MFKIQDLEVFCTIATTHTNTGKDTFSCTHTPPSSTPCSPKLKHPARLSIVQRLCTSPEGQPAAIRWCPLKGSWEASGGCERQGRWRARRSTATWLLGSGYSCCCYYGRRRRHCCRYRGVCEMQRTLSTRFAGRRTSRSALWQKSWNTPSRTPTSPTKTEQVWQGSGPHIFWALKWCFMG